MDERKRIQLQIDDLEKRLSQSIQSKGDADTSVIMSALSEREKLLVERDKITLENNKMAVEKRKVNQTTFSVLVSVLAIVATISGTVYSQLTSQATALANEKKQEDSQWDIKATELLFATEDRFQFNARLNVLKGLFPDRSERLQRIASNIDSPDNANNSQRAMVVRMIAAHPDGAKTIVTTWKHLFEADAPWLDALDKSLSAPQSTGAQKTSVAVKSRSARAWKVARKRKGHRPLPSQRHDEFGKSSMKPRTGLTINGIITGYSNGVFKAKQTLTRYEFASALQRALIKRDDEIKELTKEVQYLKAAISDLKAHQLQQPNVPTAPPHN